MSTVANRLRDIVSTANETTKGAVMRAVLKVADELEAAPAADAVPVVAWYYTETGLGSCEPKCYLSKHDVDHACEVFGGIAEPLISLSAIAALQQQLGECDAGYRAMEREVAALQARIAELEARQVTEEMITAYLEANDAYWMATDEIPRPPGKWRTGTPREATRVSLIAALAAAPSNPTTQPPEGR